MAFLGGTCLAKATYDNLAETQEELSFKKGDIITVIERDTNGLEGWWLCSLKGRRGIAPGNRLKLITGMTQEPTTNMSSTMNAPSPQTQAKWRRSWDAQQNKVVTPQKVGGVYVYDQGGKKTQNDYDVPPTRYFEPFPTNVAKNDNSQSAYDTRPSQSARSSQASLEDQGVYDVPPSQRSSYYDSPSNRSSSISMMSTGSGMSGTASNTSFASTNMCSSARSSSEINPQDIYDVPPPQPSPYRGSDPSSQQKLLGNHTPSKSIDSGIYDTPPTTALKKIDNGSLNKLKSISGSLDTLKSQNVVDEHDYDVPNEGPVNLNKSFGSRSSVLESDLYDIPRGNTPVGSNRSSFADPNSVYDIPPQVTKDTPMSLRKSDSRGSMDDLDLRMRRLSTSSGGSDLPNIPYEELPYELDAAMDLLVKLQQDLQIATNRLLAFVSSTWRGRQNLENNVYNIKMACERVATALKQFLEFGQGALANSARAADKNLIQKLYKALRPLQDYSNTISQCLGELEKAEWQVSRLVQVISLPPGVDTDPLGQIVHVTTDIVGDARIVVSIVQGNSSLLFKRAGKLENKPPLPAQKSGLGMRPRIPGERSVTPERRNSLQDRPLPATPQEQRSQQSPPRSSDKPPLPPGTLARRSSKENIIDDNNDYENDSRDWVDEYDYVQLHQAKEIGKQKMAAQNAQKTEREKTPVITEDKPKVDNSYDSVGNMSSAPNAGQVNRQGLIPSDKQMLLYYSGQITTHANVLNGAIDSFLNCIECNQPPKVFVAHSKFVVLNAHKMVYIGDTLHRNIMHAEIRNKIMHCANYLCETLKQTVIATKTAALQHPSVVAVQDMVDRVVDVSHAAHEVKIVICQAAAL